ncbi:BCE_3a_G0035360.mRNA.1.CDS.1 [Saccharomyces cerevisiae]|nr:BCE_3a_G0035360.mRNA.1.CDS.1 [Saccharomyces cerevisiae]CAI7225264.1 BCE_3a_G0035360.mRNA.1.CDS.1 [Saccharomyces cerevisiae]
MIAVYIGHRIYRRDWRHWYIKRMDIDLDSGHSLEDFEATRLERDEDKKYVSSKPLYYRIYRIRLLESVISSKFTNAYTIVEEKDRNTLDPLVTVNPPILCLSNN